MDATFYEQLSKYLTETWSYLKNQKVFGKTLKQGKNLFNPARYIFRATSEKAEERVGENFIFKGTSASYMNQYLNAGLLTFLKPNTVYTITVVASNNNIDAPIILDLSNLPAFASYNGSTAITIPAQTNGHYYGVYKTAANLSGRVLRFNFTGATLNTTCDIKIMIAEGEVVPTYVSYASDPTPTLSNPVALKSVEPLLNIRTANKNLLDYKSFFDTINLSPRVGGSNGVFFPTADKVDKQESIPVDGRKVAKLVVFGGLQNVVYTSKLFKANTQYTLKLDYKYALSNVILFLYYYTDGTRTEYQFNNNGAVWSSRTATSTAGKTVVGMGFYFSSGTTCYIDLDSIMLNEGTVAPPYEPHRGSITQVELKDVDSIPIELYSDALGTKDEVDVDRGVVIKRVGKYTYKNGDNWYINSYGNNNFAYQVSSSGNDISGNLYNVVRNTHFKTGRSKPNGSWVSYSSNMVATYLFCAYPFADMGGGVAQGDNAALKAWLNTLEKPFEIIYPLGREQIIHLHEDTISQLKGALLRRPDNDIDYNLWVESTPEPTITYDTFKWQEPVFDRTLQNAKNARMGIQADFAKGIFSDTVWNRIKGNQIVIKYLISWFYEYVPVELLDLAVKKQDLAGFASWADVESWITDLDLNEMAANDRTLMKQLPTAHANYVPPKNDYVGGLGSGSTSPDWNDLNLLERTLQLIKEIILVTFENYRICGEPITSANTQQIDII